MAGPESRSSVRVMRVAVGLAAMVLAVAGCGGDGAGSGDDSSADKSSSQPAAETSSESTDKPEDCLPVSKEMSRAIATGQEDGVGMKPVAEAAVKSPDFRNAYFIAITFSATGVDDQTGVWVSNLLYPGDGIIMAADPTAQQFTDWPDADKTDAQISTDDPSVDAAKSCL